MAEIEPGYQHPVHVLPTPQRGSPGQGIKTARQRASSPPGLTGLQVCHLDSSHRQFFRFSSPGSVQPQRWRSGQLPSSRSSSSSSSPPPHPLLCLWPVTSSPRASPSSASRPYQLTLPTAAGLRGRREEKQTRTSFDPARAEFLAQPVVLLPPRRRQRQRQRHRNIRPTASCLQLAIPPGSQRIAMPPTRSDSSASSSRNGHDNPPVRPPPCP